MADPISSLRTNRGEPTLFDRLSTAGQISQEDQYAANPESQFSKGLRAGAAGLTAGEFASEALRKEVAGDKEFADSRDRALQTVRDTRMYAPRVSSLRDVNSIGDAGDFAAGAIGQGAMSMAPTIAAAALTRGRGLAGKATAFGGAMVPAYEMERGEAALNQYQYPEQMKASAQERDLAATAKGGINAALESIVPAGLGGSLLRKPAGSLLGHIGREAVTEGLTEGAQQLVGYGAQKYIDPNKELDPWDVADAVAAGALTGGAMSGATRGPAHAAQAILDKAPKPQMPEIKNPFQRGDEAGGVVDLPEDPSGGGSGPADTMLGKVAGLGAAVQDRFGDDIAAAGGKAKDIVSDTLDRMTEAVDTSANPGEFLNKVFGSNIDEEAAADLSGQPNPTLKGATFEETEANIARDDEQRVARAARYADELLNDPATPAEIKQRVADMGGDYANPDNQSFVARTLVAQRGGEKITKAVQDLVDLGKSAFAKGSEAAGEGLSAAKKAVGDAATAAQDRIVKKNLQSATPAEQAAFGKVIFDGLTDEAKANPAVRRQLSDVTNAMMAFAAKTGDVTAKDLPTLTKLSNAMSLFKDPDAMAQQLVEYAGLPRTEDSFLSRIKRITNAQQDLKQPNSFLVSSLTPEARGQLTAPQLQRVAQLVDQFTVIDSADSKKGTALVQGLASAFGSPESARAVLDYYAQQNKADLRFDPNETLQEDGSNSVNEQDAPKASYQFKDAKAMRPFSVLRGTQRGAKESSRAAVDLKGSGSVGPNAQTRQVPYSEYVANTEGNPEAEVKRIAADLKERIAGHEKRTDEDRSQQINELKGELSAMREAYKKGGAKAALDLYEVLEVKDAQQDDTKATDEDLNKYGKLTKDPTASKTRVTFQRTDGTKFTLSAESMWKAQGDKEGSGKGENADKRMRRLFSDAVASVLAREDVEKLVTTLDGVMLDRKSEKLVKPKRNREYMYTVQHALNEASGTLNGLKDTLTKVTDEFTDLLSEQGEEAESRREEIKSVLQQNIDRQRQRLDELKETGGGVPAQAIVREKMRLYREAAADISGLEFEHNVERADDERPGVVENKPGISRLRDEMDTSKGARFAEEDTGMAVGSTRAPKTGTGKNVPPGKLEALLNAGTAVLRDGVYFITDADATKYLAGTDKHDRIYVNVGKLRKSPNAMVDYLSSSEPKQKMLKLLGVSAEQLQETLGNTKRIAAFLRDHERSHVENNDRDVYPKGADGKLDLDHPTSIAIEARATYDALTESEREKLGIAARPKAPAKTAPASESLRAAKAAAAKNPAASSRETAKKVNDSQALSPDAFTALHDVAVKENYSRLDTPAKVLKFAAMAAKAREQLKKIPELERTDEQDELRFKLNDMFDQSKGFAFDWESLWDGLDPTDAQKAQLEDLIRPKAEPGTARQSTMKPKRGRPGKIDQQAILDEIARIRGKDVKVAFAKFADIGASGEFSMNKDKTKRLIKIAINSLNPMSVAWHESLHDFMAVLGGSQAERKLKADLLDAAEAPQVMAKLRELLKDHPDALKQIETDREERLAYMYQFWAEGALPLGQTGTNIFSRAVTFFREMLGVLSQDQKIDQLLTALHSGKFAEPSLVGAVLEDLKAKTLSDKAREVSGPIADAAEAMFTGATDRLRDTNVDALTELADMFHREPGRENSGELPFLQRRAQQVGKRLNKLQDILKDTSTEDRRRALENMQAMKPASTPLEKELAAYLKEMRDYMVDRGVKRFDTKTKKWTDLGNVKDYFPRVWDKEAIRNNEAEFVGLMEQYIGKAQARETFNALVNGDGSLELAENEHTLGFTPWNPSVLDRQFTFINPSNAAAFAKFQSKDMADIMTSYTQRAVHRAEYAHTFGNDGEVITSKFLEAQKQGATQDELAMARKATMAMEGTLGYDFNPRLKEVMSGIVTYQNIVLLPLSLFSNLIDPLGVAMRSNDMKEAWKAFTYGMKGIADQLRGAGDDAQTEMAKTLGIIDEQNMLEAMGHVYNSMHMSSFLKNINSKFFRYNGMEMWNQRMRVAAMMAAQRFILANLGHERYQSELGITDSDVFQLADGTIALTKDQLLQAGAKKSEVSDIEKRIQAAVFKWVDGAVLRPNAAHRPVWGSDPRYQLIFHLKQFTFSFHNTILRRVGEELKHGNVAPGWILMSYVPFMFLSDVLKGSLTGTLNTTADLYDVASQSIARSGIMGTGVFGADAMGDLERGKLPGTSFLGPAFDHLMTLLSDITGHAGVDQVINRSVPFAKYI